MQTKYSGSATNGLSQSQDCVSISANTKIGLFYFADKNL